MDDDWELRKVRVPKGTHLSQSKDSEGAQRDLLREDGTNKLLGPAESMPVDEDDLNHYRRNPPPQDLGEREPSWLAQLLGDVVEELIEEIDWEAVFEHIIAPAIKRTKNRVANRFRSTFGRTKTEIVEFVPDHPSTALDTQDHDESFAVSREEYRQRVLLVLTAEAFASRERENLAKARIDEANLPEELVRAVRLVLEGNASSLTVDELAVVREFLAEVPVPTGPYPLLRASDQAVMDSQALPAAPPPTGQAG